MSAKSAEENCRKLVTLGYSKTKAQKALKDAGNIFSKAKEMLERQQQQAEKEQQQQDLIKRRQQEEDERRKADADKRALGVATPPAQPTSKDAKRSHPCIVQYKSCRYGKFCLLKDLPGDVCISHFNSGCIYGSACRNRHSIDGVDIRHYVPNAPNAPPLDDGVMHRKEDGGVVVVSEVKGGGVVLADVTYPTGHRPQVEGRQLAQAPEYMWNAVRGSEASYSDPLQAPSLWDAGMDAEEGPTPFLDLARQQRNGTIHNIPSQRIHAVDASASAPAKAVKFGEPGFMGHPCLLQCGGCKYGDACNHATRPADVCVFFLNSRCNFTGAQCRFRHEDVMTMAPASSMAALRNQTAGSPMVGHSSTTSPSMNFVLKPNTVVGGQPMSMWSLGDSTEQLERQYAPPRHFAGVQGTFTVSDAPLPTLHTLRGVYSSPTIGPSAPQRSEDESSSFCMLRDVFPDVDPGCLLHALRIANGDRSRVADAIASSNANEDTTTLAALLGQEATSEDARLSDVSCSSDPLLSLCAVFPLLEPSLIEDALHRAEGDTNTAFAMLVASTEHIASAELHARTRTTGLSTADGLKVQRLQSMFPDLPGEVIEECFVACDRSTQRCIDGLTQLVDDLHSMDQRSQVGDAAMKGSCFPGTGSLQITDTDGVCDGSFSVTSDATEGFSVVASTLPSQTDLYHSVAQEALELGDWRRTRERAYFLNSCRVRLLAMAAEAYAHGNGRGAKQLSTKAASLYAEYRKLNMIAMRALEEERTSGNPVSVLDLHGFHVDEALDVVMRRLQLCETKSVARVKIIIGRGAHSVQGKSTVFPAVLNTLRHEPQIANHWQVVSVKPAVIEVRRWNR